MRNIIIIALIFMLPLESVAQKRTQGSCIIVEDGIQGEYKGEMMSGKPHGKGHTVYKSGNIYEGEYAYGKREGQGVYFFTDGEKYDGQWVQGHQHGFGTFYFASKDKYVGFWNRDYQHGHGVMYYFNGDKYDGNWNQDKRQGRGRYTFSDGAYYDGEWENNKKWGRGIYVNIDGSRIEGNWINDLKEGEGILTTKDGDVHVCVWKNDILQSINPPLIQKKWTGTGFALLDNYIVTNYHVVDGAKLIMVQDKFDINIKYEAKVVAIDRDNDLAIIKLKENSIIHNEIPYSIKTTSSDVGENVWVLGYPLISTMGNEIKLTTGVISAKSGFENNISMYQISAPLQPGNSGGPVFDEKGNLIGIVCAHHLGTENVGYAIKSAFLKNLADSSFDVNILPHVNKLTTKNLPDKVKAVKDYIYIIVCSK